MPQFDFDTIVPRFGSDSAKWGSSDDPELLPMWVADMDFATAPVVVEALQKRVAHGVFGYCKVPNDYYQAVINWFGSRHHFAIQRDWLLYTSGVLPALSAIIKAVAKPGEGVIVQTPVYNCFFSCIRNMGCEVVENPLVNQDGYYQMDFADLERQAARPEVTALLLCNPHNPVGRAWRAEELTKLGDICIKHGVTVISDEIHCDLVFPHYQHQVFAGLGEAYLHNSVTASSPSKAFNLAGLQIANIVCPDPRLRSRIDRALNQHEVCDVNPFGVTALIAAYTQGLPWLQQLNDYLLANYRLVASFIAEHLPYLTLTRSEATYLAWIDCRELGLSSAELSQALQEQGQVLINQGSLYGQHTDGFIRLNMACPSSQLKQGLTRIHRVFEQLHSAPV